MAESTTSIASVEQAPLDQGAVEGILEQAFSGGTPTPRKAPAPPEPEQEPVEAESETDELTPDDLPESAEPQPPANSVEFEIVHNGTQHKLSREETIRLAQQGFDYTQKTQGLAEKAKQVDAILQRAMDVENIIPTLAQEMAVVKQYESQLQQYQKIDWVRLATDDPLDYPKYRAQYDQLVQGYQAANGQLQQKAQFVAEQRTAITSEKLKQESARLSELIPDWKDPEKYQSGAKELSGWLIKQGADPSQVASLTDALTVSIAHKAMLYDRLLSAKNDRSKQLRTAPPVVRPGTVAQSDAKTNFQKAQVAIRKAGRQGDHRTQEKIAEAMFIKAFK